MFRDRFSKARDEGLFDDENDDVLDGDLGEFQDPSILSDLEGSDQEFYQRIRKRNKSERGDRSEGDKKSKNKRRKQKGRNDRRDPDWDNFKG